MSGTKPVSFMVAMKTFFGFADGQTLTQFSTAVKSLSDGDKEYFRNHLTQVGFNIA
jgi:hypothetical protein